MILDRCRPTPSVINFNTFRAALSANADGKPMFRSRRDEWSPVKSSRLGESGGRKRRRLAFAQRLGREHADRLIEHAIEVQAGAEVQKRAAKADRRAVHEDEFARHPHRPFLLQGLMHLKRLLASILARRDAVGDRAHAIVEQRRIDEARPDVQNLGEIARQAVKTPGLIGVEAAVEIIMQQAFVEFDHAADEFRRENADAAIIEQIDAEGLPDLALPCAGFARKTV